jgi:hypothetical protein
MGDLLKSRYSPGLCEGNRLQSLLNQIPVNFPIYVLPVKWATTQKTIISVLSVKI